jgi:ABC-type enterochelin transport system ATPase subunit
VIEVHNLTKQYGPFTAVDDISFRVERGEILGFLGPNWLNWPRSKNSRNRMKKRRVL